MKSKWRNRYYRFPNPDFEIIERYGRTRIHIATNWATQHFVVIWWDKREYETLDRYRTLYQTGWLARAHRWVKYHMDRGHDFSTLQSRQHRLLYGWIRKLCQR